MSNVKNCFNCKHGSTVQYLTEERELENYKDLAQCDSIDKLYHLVELNNGNPIQFPQYNSKANNPRCKFWEQGNDQNNND